jgi:hypothetical protein
MEKYKKNINITWSLRVLVGSLFFFICLLMAFLICFLLVDLCSGISGRNFTPVSTITGILIGISSLFFSIREYLTTVQMASSLILVEFLIFYLIGFFIGSYDIDSLFIQWFVITNLYIALPWLIGFGIGRLVRKEQ